jgi:hypothetical protein
MVTRIVMVVVCKTNDADGQMLELAGGRLVDVPNDEDVNGRLLDIADGVLEAAEGVVTQEQALETWFGSPEHIETKSGRSLEAVLVVVVYVLQKGVTWVFAGFMNWRRQLFC